MRRLLQVLAICSTVLATRVNHVLHERRTFEPFGWKKSHRADQDDIIPLRIGMKQQNLHMLEDLLMDVAHPDSPAYGQYWTTEKVVDFFAPSESTVRSIQKWLSTSGIAEDKLRHFPNKGWIELNVTVATAEWFLDTEYHIYEHSSGIKQIGCLSYSVPEYVSEHIEIIKPTMHFDRRVPEERAHLRKRVTGNPNQSSRGYGHSGLKTNGAKVEGPLSLENCDEFITPNCLRALYNFYYTPQATTKNSFAIVELTPQAYVASDLDLFFKNFSSTQLGQRPQLVSIDGGVVQNTTKNFTFNGESDLDLEYAMVLTNPQPITLLQTGDLAEGGGFDNWLDAVDGSYCTFEGGDDPDQDRIYPDTQPGGYNKSESCGIIQPPFVISVSYGEDEGQPGATYRYATRQCNEYGKLGLLGTTVLYSSGDDGVSGASGICQNSSSEFNPVFPASCSYVVSVGATQINSGSNRLRTAIYSGGGFSDIFSMPSYQAAAVTNFLKEHPPPYSEAQFNNSGMVVYTRLIPERANYVIALDGLFEVVFGTSAAAPLVGSMIAMVNDARLSVGKSPVGFINPAIYSATFADAFNDITRGITQAVSGLLIITSSWKGLGTPNFEKLLSRFLDLP
ncbi:subtilisin-like protein [Lactarius quietus]|nr:subtilisin-like protein [Lactarius quietus]